MCCLISIHAPPRGATQLVHLCRCHLLFQFTPLREGRPAPTQCAGQRHYFNSRPSARGDVAGFLPFLHLLISIHAPPRGATLRQPRGGCRHRISIHAPPRGATRIITRSRRRCPFQFTPLREGRRAGDSGHRHRPDISIHAPPRGATASGAAGHARHRISIHAPPRGATSDTSRSIALCKISIHAPPRGATRRCDERLEAHPISIHAPPRGATLICLL